MKKEKIKYYNVRNLISAIPDAHYYMIIGERSNGKTYSTLDYCLDRYFTKGEEFAYIRRFDEDIKSSRMKVLFSSHINNKLIEKYSNGKWNNIFYYSHAFYLLHVDPKNPSDRIVSESPIGYAFAISRYEHDKSTSYPNIRNIVFDEFLTRQAYLPDEFIAFTNVLSTLIRLRDDVKIFMLGNTINKYAPYFNEMGLTHVKDMKVGQREVYTYDGSKLKVAVEFSDLPNKDKPSNVYFAFNNPKLNMITGQNGVWELELYPHLTEEMKYIQKNVLYRYYVCWDTQILECEIVKKDKLLFTFVHMKTTPIKENNRNIVYTTEHNPKPNYRRKITRALSKIEEKILWFYKREKVFYQSNDVGEIMRNYISWCSKTKIEY